jgi:hypothetical protein
MIDHESFEDGVPNTNPVSPGGMIEFSPEKHLFWMLIQACDPLQQELIGSNEYLPTSSNTLACRVP